MQVHAIYENGRLRFQQPIRLKAQRIELDVTIPDNCIEMEPQNAPESSQTQTGRQSPTGQRLDAILGKWRHHGGTSGKDIYKAIWHAHLEDKYLARR